MNILYIVPPVAAYLLGSVSSAVWLARRHGINIREYGSGNAGATNILRVLGPKAALPVFVFDFLKGLFAVLLAGFTALDPVENPELRIAYEIVLGACAVTGHIFPVFASFRGGKGVATIAGVVAAIAPAPMLMSLSVFVAVLVAAHYVSLASISAAVSFPLFVIVLFGIVLKPDTTGNTLKIFSLAASLMIVLTHRKNIRRLRNGSENKISFKRKRDAENRV